MIIMFGKRDLGNTYYYGSDTHRYINELICRKGEMLMVSPYVDRYYAELMLKKSRGRKFYLISSSVEDDVLRLLKGGSRLWILAYLGLSMILLGLLIFIGAAGAILPLRALRRNRKARKDQRAQRTGRQLLVLLIRRAVDGNAPALAAGVVACGADAAKSLRVIGANQRDFGQPTLLQHFRSCTAAWDALRAFPGELYARVPSARIFAASASRAASLWAASISRRQ